MSVGGIDEECIHPGLDQGHSAFVAVTEETDSSANAQATIVILGGTRVLFGLHKVFKGNQPGKFTGLVNEGQTLDFVLRKEGEGFILRQVRRTGNERHRGHNIAHEGVFIVRAREVANIAVGNNTFKFAIFGDHRQTRNLVIAAQIIVFADSCVSTDGDGINDHARFGAFHAINMRCLILDRKVAVDHAHAA